MWHDPRAGGRARKGGASSRRSGDHRAPRTAAFRAPLRLGTGPALDVEVAYATERMGAPHVSLGPSPRGSPGARVGGGQAVRKVGEADGAPPVVLPGSQVLS